MIRRPQTLQAAAAESESYEDFGHNLKDFLHAFAEAQRLAAPLDRMLAPEPPRLAERFPAGTICDAFLAATADFLARRSGLASPAWALKEDLALETPWFSPDFPGVRWLLFRDTPSAFKDKNIFVFESALQVA